MAAGIPGGFLLWTTDFHGATLANLDSLLPEALSPLEEQAGVTWVLAVAVEKYKRVAPLAFTGEDGEPLGVMPNLLVVPPQLEREGKEILNGFFEFNHNPHS